MLIRAGVAPNFAVDLLSLSQKVFQQGIALAVQIEAGHRNGVWHIDRLVSSELSTLNEAKYDSFFLPDQ